MTKVARDSEGAVVQAFRPGAVQKVTVSGTSAAVTNPFGGVTTLVRIFSTTACHYVLAGTPVATTDHTPLAANSFEYVSVRPGEKIAFIQSSAGGTAHVTEGA